MLSLKNTFFKEGFENKSRKTGVIAQNLDRLGYKYEAGDFLGTI